MISNKNIIIKFNFSQILRKILIENFFLNVPSVTEKPLPRSGTSSACVEINFSLSWRTVFLIISIISVLDEFIITGN